YLQMNFASLGRGTKLGPPRRPNDAIVACRGHNSVERPGRMRVKDYPPETRKLCPHIALSRVAIGGLAATVNITSAPSRALQIDGPSMAQCGPPRSRQDEASFPP